jgi:glycerol-3-phosphate cytidylyltransferase
MKIGFYPMAADILHAGHMIALEEAKNNCDYLIVGLNCKPDGKAPIQSIYERFMQLRAVKFIDEIIPYEGKTDLELLASSLDYHIRFVGEDYLNKEWDG